MAWTRVYELLGDKVTEFHDDDGRLLETHVERHSIWDGDYAYTDKYNSYDKKIGSFVKEDEDEEDKDD